MYLAWRWQMTRLRERGEGHEEMRIGPYENQGEYVLIYLDVHVSRSLFGPDYLLITARHTTQSFRLLVNDRKFSARNSVFLSHQTSQQ